MGMAGRVKFKIDSSAVGEVTSIDDWTQSVEIFTAQSVDSTIVQKLTDNIKDLGSISVNGLLDLGNAGHQGLVADIGASQTCTIEFSNGATYGLTGICREFTISGMGLGNPLGFKYVIELTAAPTFTAAGGGD